MRLWLSEDERRPDPEPVARPTTAPRCSRGSDCWVVVVGGLLVVVGVARRSRRTSGGCGPASPASVSARRPRLHPRPHGARRRLTSSSGQVVLVVRRSRCRRPSRRRSRRRPRRRRRRPSPRRRPTRRRRRRRRPRRTRRRRRRRRILASAADPRPARPGTRRGARDHGTQSGARSAPSPGMQLDLEHGRLLVLDLGDADGPLPAGVAGHRRREVERGHARRPRRSAPTSSPMVESGVTSRSASRASRARSSAVTARSGIQLVRDLAQHGGDLRAVVRSG